MKSALAKARDEWIVSDEGKGCCKGQASGQYLQNRLERAFLAGANSSDERIKELEGWFDELIYYLEYIEANHEPRTAREWIDRLQTLKGGK